MVNAFENTLYEELLRVVYEVEKNAFIDVLKKGLANGPTALEIASEALRSLIKEIFERFQHKDIIFPEFFLMYEAIHAGFGLVLPLMRSSNEETRGSPGYPDQDFLTA